MFKTEYQIKNEDINYGGHVGNERALLFFQYARINFFESLGFSELDLGDNVGVIQKNAFVEYNKQLFLDDKITICITKLTFSKTTFEMTYEIYNQDNIKVISGSTLMVCYNYTSNRIKKVPELFKEKATSIISGDLQ